MSSKHLPSHWEIYKRRAWWEASPLYLAGLSAAIVSLFRGREEELRRFAVGTYFRAISRDLHPDVDASPEAHDTYVRLTGAIAQIRDMGSDELKQHVERYGGTRNPFFSRTRALYDEIDRLHALLEEHGIEA